jgi:cytochrome c oxidase subunit 4
MVMSKNKTHSSGYCTYLWALVALLVLTALSVFITRFELGPCNTAASLLIAGAEALIVLAYFMNLKFESRFYKIMTTLVIVIFLFMLFITFFDYMNRVY